MRAFAEILEPRRLLATLPAGFIETRLALGLENPTAMAVAPDGRLFVSEQAGRVRLVSTDGGLAPTPFITLDEIDTRAEFGLQSVAFDPDFATNRFVYINYTHIDPVFSISRQRIIRVTADPAGDLALPGSEMLIFEFDPLFTGLMHVGGAMRFLPDGTLLATHGDAGFFAGAQSLTTTHGKVIRINPDGSIPTDNPFYSQADGKYRAIWAVGLRNPYTLDIEPGTGRAAINEVGGSSFEEINPAIPGANYGWPTTEGDFDPQEFPDLTRPLFAYSHADGCAITGGAFFNPADPDGPGALGQDFVGQYFFTDFCGGWIKTVDLSATAPTPEPFAAGIDAPLYPTIAPDGTLFYIERNTGSVYWVRGTSTLAPVITNPPEDLTVSIGQPATFTVVASGQDLSFQWRRNGDDIPDATASSYALVAPSAGDSGATFTVRVSNPFGAVVSDPATLTVLNNHVPAPMILTPEDGLIYQAGDTIEFSGTAIDPEDGELSASSLTWWVNFHHNVHFHPFMPETSGIAAGSFVIPATGETDADVFFRIHLRAVDSMGAPAETTVDVIPRTAEISIRTVPEGITILLDGQPRVAPFTFTGVTGIIRHVAAPALVSIAGQTHQFVDWSDGGAAAHEFATPADDATLLANYIDITPPQVLDADFLFDTPAPPHRIMFQFSEDVSASLSGGDLIVQRFGDDEPLPAELLDFDHATNTAVFHFPQFPGGVLPEGNYRAVLGSTGVTDAQGNPLPADHTIEFFVFPGDANRDRSVDITDFAILAAGFNLPGTFTQGDFDYSGTVEIGDFAILASRFNTELAANRAAGAAAVAPPPQSPARTFAAQRLAEDVLDKQ